MNKVAYTVWPFFLVVIALVCFYYDLQVAAVVIGMFAFAIFAWIVRSDLGDQQISYNYSRAELEEKRVAFIQALATLSPDRYSALGLEFPELDIDFEGKPIVRLRGTNILLECFQKFLADSTDQEFASLHWYNDDKSLQEKFGMSRDAVRAQWHLTVTHLSDGGYITKNSAAGNHSYLWFGKSREKLVRWFSEGTVERLNLGEAE
jgi:hypothetical protein